MHQVAVHANEFRRHTAFSSQPIIIILRQLLFIVALFQMPTKLYMIEKGFLEVYCSCRKLVQT
jgi:hypothetical protein